MALFAGAAALFAGAAATIGGVCATEGATSSAPVADMEVDDDHHQINATAAAIASEAKKTREALIGAEDNPALTASEPDRRRRLEVAGVAIEDECVVSTLFIFPGSACWH